MANYQKMYALLCCAIDGVLDPLNKIPAAKLYADVLQTALLEAEEIYVRDDAPLGTSSKGAASTSQPLCP